MKPEHLKLLRDKLWRLNHLYWIMDKEGKPVRFQMTPEQLKYFDGMHKEQIGSLVRTMTNHVASSARAETLKQNEDILQGHRWIATLDS